MPDYRFIINEQECQIISEMCEFTAKSSSCCWNPALMVAIDDESTGCSGQNDGETNESAADSGYLTMKRGERLRDCPTLLAERYGLVEIGGYEGLYLQIYADWRGFKRVLSGLSATSFGIPVEAGIQRGAGIGEDLTLPVDMYSIVVFSRVTDGYAPVLQVLT